MAVTGAAPTTREVVADRLQQRLVKTGGRLVKHARYYWLLLAEGHLTQRASPTIPISRRRKRRTTIA